MASCVSSSALELGQYTLTFRNTEPDPSNIVHFSIYLRSMAFRQVGTYIVWTSASSSPSVICQDRVTIASPCGVGSKVVEDFHLVGRIVRPKHSYRNVDTA